MGTGRTTRALIPPTPRSYFMCPDRGRGEGHQEPCSRGHSMSLGSSHSMVGTRAGSAHLYQSNSHRTTQRDMCTKTIAPSSLRDEGEAWWRTRRPGMLSLMTAH